MLLRSTLAAAAVLAALPAAAAASSIVYVKEGDVWLISPDGARDHRVTTEGGYSWPSQADDGTILAKRAGSFVRLRPDGTRIGAPVPGIGSDSAHSGNLTVMAGPADPRISPDGTRFAYWVSARAIGTCPPFDPHNCRFSDTDYTFVSHVDRFTDGTEFGAVRDYRDPSWVGNDRLLVANYGIGLVSAGALSTVGAGEGGLQGFFEEPAGVPTAGQPQLSRQGDKLAVVGGSEAFGPAQEGLYLYGVGAAGREPKCAATSAAPPSGKYVAPSWSPDGTALAINQSDGIHVMENIPDLRAPEPNCGQITDRVLVRGSSPGWGPADVPGGAPGASAPPPPATGAPRAYTGLRIASRQRGRAVRVRLTVPAAGTSVRVRLLRGGRAAGGVTRTGVGAGPLTVRARLDRRARTALQAAGRLRLRVRVTVTPPGGAPLTATRAVTLRR